MIRTASKADIPRMVEMGRRFLAESPYRELLTENPDAMRQLGERIMDNPGGCILVSESNGQVTGMLGLIVYEHLISGETVGGEVFWWVDPEARGDGIRLLRAAEITAKERGAKHMQMISPNDRLGNLYMRRGYKFMETTYVRAL